MKLIFRLKKFFFSKKNYFLFFYFCILFVSTVYIFLKFFYWKSTFKIWEITVFFAFCFFFVVTIIILFYLEYSKIHRIKPNFNLDHLSQILNAQKTIILIFEPSTQKIIWTNDDSFFMNFFRIKKYYEFPLSTVLTPAILQKIENKEKFKLLQLFLKNINKKQERFLISFLPDNILILQNEKKQVDLENFFVKNQLIFFLLEVDSGDFILDPENLLDQQSPQISAFIDLKLNKILSNCQGWLAGTKPSCFTMLLTNEHFQILKKNKFDFIKKLTNDIYHEFKIRLTFSAGVYDGYSGFFMNENFIDYDFSIIYGYQQSLRALKISQTRLGDQLTLIDRNGKIKFFGEQTVNEGIPVRYVDKDYRRFLILLSKYQNIFIVGHRNADFDVCGAGLGLKFFLENYFTNKKNIFFVMQKVDVDTKQEVNKILKNNQQKYEELICSNFLFWSNKKAKANQKNALILIDANKPQIVDISSLQMKKMKGIFILDHHIDNFSFSSLTFKLINTKFSSTSEIVTLFLQLYEQQGKSLLFPQAIFHLLLLGILVDTNNLQNNIGKQTIKCINFLVQKGINLSQAINQMNSYKETFIAQKIESIFVDPNKVILKVFDKVIQKNMAAVLAEDYLLKKDVHVIFVVLFDNSDRIFVSARSKINFNVGKICQQIGSGGGSNNRAAAKIIGNTVDDVIDKITPLIKEQSGTVKNRVK